VWTLSEAVKGTSAVLSTDYIYIFGPDTTVSRINISDRFNFSTPQTMAARNTWTFVYGYPFACRQAVLKFGDDICLLLPFYDATQNPSPGNQPVVFRLSRGGAGNPPNLLPDATFVAQMQSNANSYFTRHVPVNVHTGTTAHFGLVAVATNENNLLVYSFTQSGFCYWQYPQTFLAQDLHFLVHPLVNYFRLTI
jgi:hypothetical protein